MVLGGAERSKHRPKIGVHGTQQRCAGSWGRLVPNCRHLRRGPGASGRFGTVRGVARPRNNLHGDQYFGCRRERRTQTARGRGEGGVSIGGGLGVLGWASGWGKGVRELANDGSGACRAPPDPHRHIVGRESRDGWGALGARGRGSGKRVQRSLVGSVGSVGSGHAKCGAQTQTDRR